jgi:hypothetical protein
MKITESGVLKCNFAALLVLLFSAASLPWSRAQNPELQERVAEVKEAAARNKQALAQYTWVEQVNISLKGELKKQERFQVRLGPDGKPQKTSLDPPPEEPSGGRLKKHIVEKKKEEYKEYADKMKTLAQQYVPPEKDLLEQAYQQGNILIGPVAGNPEVVQLVIKNYLKPGDSMTLMFDKTQKALVQVQIASYMDDPKDAMTLKVTFTREPNGPSHVSGVVIDGASKQLNVATQNSNYQHL